MVLEITLSKVIILQRNDCGTGDNSFKSSFYRGRIVVLVITHSKVIIFQRNDCGTGDNSFKSYHFTEK